MKFRDDSDEMACGAAIPYAKPEIVPYVMCLRRAGHAGEHVAMSSAAAEADGVCHRCRAPLDGHAEGCR